MNQDTAKTVAILLVIAFIVLMIMKGREGFHRGYWPAYWHSSYWSYPYRYYYPYRYRRRHRHWWPWW